MKKRPDGTRSKDLLGNRYGKLTVTERLRTNNFRKSVWLCACDCGGSAAPTTGSLNSGMAQSCGCVQAERTREAVTKHGYSVGNVPTEYRRWRSMMNRCRDPASINGRGYASRGIEVCEKWRCDFPAFLKDMGPIPSPNHTLDRIENDKGYSPDNCRWATMSEQNNNKRYHRFVMISGERLNLAQACRKYGITYFTARWRLNAGWSTEKVFGVALK